MLRAIPFLVLVAAAPAFAVELNYTWKKGEVHRFSYEDETSFKMSMAGMPGMQGMPGMGGMGGMPGMAEGGMDARMKVRSVFSEKVLSVRGDGTADVELTIERLDMFQEGAKVASITSIPPAARVVKAEIDRKGHAKFFHMVTVYVVKDQFYVGIHKASAGPTGASASATGFDGTTVTLVASVNPKTGTVTASAKVSGPPPPVLTKTRVKQEDPSVDVVPKQLLEMMVLPDGSMEPGSESRIDTPFGTIVEKLEGLKGSVATLKVGVAGKKVTVQAPAEDEGEDEGDDEMAAPKGMNGMNGTMGGGGQEMAGMKMDLDATIGFDVAAGKLLRLAGTMGQDMSMGGMASVKTQSQFTLDRVP